MPLHVKIAKTLDPDLWNVVQATLQMRERTLRFSATVRALMRVLLTGGSGFVGSYVAEQLTGLGHTVRALVRPQSDSKLLKTLKNIEFAPGAVEDRRSLDAAVTGVDAIIHVAGLVKARRPEEFFAVNAEGTRILVAAAEAHAPGLRRFEYVSSLSAVGPCPDGKPVPDDAPPRPVTQYGRSKLAGEQAVLAAKDRLPVTVIRPPLIYGPRDRETLAFFTSVKRGVLPVLGDGTNTLSVVYGEDCASAIVRATVTDGPSGRTYFLDDGSVYVWRDALAELENEARLAPENAKLALEMSRLYARLGDREKARMQAKNAARLRRTESNIPESLRNDARR